VVLGDYVIEYGDDDTGDEFAREKLNHQWLWMHSSSSSLYFFCFRHHPRQNPLLRSVFEPCNNDQISVSVELCLLDLFEVTLKAPSTYNI
jgi:hypothetical protein